MLESVGCRGAGHPPFLLTGRQCVLIKTEVFFHLEHLICDPVGILSPASEVYKEFSLRLESAREPVLQAVVEGHCAVMETLLRSRIQRSISE